MNQEGDLDEEGREILPSMREENRGENRQKVLQSPLPVQGLGEKKPSYKPGGIHKQKHTAYYGNTKLDRAWCKDCEQQSFIIDGIKQCCGKRFTSKETNKKVYICPPDKRRKYLSQIKKDSIRISQDDKCIYCGITFGKKFTVAGEDFISAVCFDHFSPLELSYDNSIENFVACCRQCNAFKGSLVFECFEDAQKYIIDERLKRGFPILKETT